MLTFTAKIRIIGINPYVLIPGIILKEIFQKAGKEKGAIPVKLKIAGSPFIQTLVKYSGKWRLYLNTPMRRAAGKDVGDIIDINIDFDAKKRTIFVHPKLKAAMNKNKKAKKTFDKISPSRQKEILRYIGNLKSPGAIDKNIQRVIVHLTGKGPFAGRT